MLSRRCRFLIYTMETKTVAKAHRMPGPVKSAIRPTLALKGKRQSQVKLETIVVLVSEE